MTDTDYFEEKYIFDWNFYLVSSSELNEKNIYKKDDVIEYFKINDENIYNTITKREKSYLLLNIKQTSQMLFRYICCKHVSLMRILTLPSIPKNSVYEAVFIEYRCFPHVEFLIRNAIYKLGEYWSHTIVCGTKNYQYISKIIGKISSNIRIIKTN